MIEKLLENWLDSASERSYQSVFVQILSAKGYRVVHSTRHTALEYGKDVLAIDTDGIGCAYQLKGHPSGKMGLKQFRNEIQPQLVQLMSQPVVFPGFPSGAHKAYLVSNGYFDEEVQRAVDDLNRQPHYISKVSLVSRGDLLILCKKFGTNLWPSELGDSRLLLELFLSDSKDILPSSKLAKLLYKILTLNSKEKKLDSKAAFERAVTSAALLTGIATAHFAEAQNHFANVAAWTVFSVSIIAAGEKYGYKIDGSSLGTLKLAEAIIGDSLTELWNEVSSREYLFEGKSFTDPEVYRWRYTTLLGLLSSLSLQDESSPFLTEADRNSLKQWLIKPHKDIDLWGEGAVASLVPWLLWLRKHDPTLRPDIKLSELAKVVIERNQNDSQYPLASPYYQYCDIARDNLQHIPPGHASANTKEDSAGSSYTAQPLLHLLVRTNLKQTCKKLWPDFSRIEHRVCLPDEGWEYCMLNIRSGVDQTRMYPLTYSWENLKREATTPRGPVVPAELADRPWLLSLWWQVAPQRYNSETNKAFAERVFPGWFG